MPRKKPPKAPTVPGLTRRGKRAYFERILPKIGRVSKALRCDYDDPRAVERAQALNTLAERGDSAVIARWRDEGHPPITEMVRAVRQGDYPSLRRLNVRGPSLGRAIDEFMTRAENTLNLKSIRQYRSILRKVAGHFGRDRALADITSTEAEAFLHGSGWGANSQANAKTVCGSVWALVIDREREAARKAGAEPNVAHNPWRGNVKVRGKAKPRHAYLRPEEWRTLIAHRAVKGTPTAALLGLATLAGLRRGELCNLRTGFDVDLEAGVIRVQPRGGEWEWAPKGYTHGITNSVRDIPIVPALRALLEEHVRRGYAGKRFFLHASSHDRPLTGETASRWVEAAFTAAGLTYGRDDEDSLTAHSLRHTFATWLVSDGIPIPTVAALCGNTPEITLSTYSHHMSADLDRAMDALEARTR